MAEFSIQDLAKRTNESERQLRSWLARGLIGSEDEDSLVLEDVARVHMIRFVLRRGISSESLEGSAVSIRALLDRFLPRLRPPEHVYSLDEAAEALDLDPDVLRPFWTAIGLADEFEEAGDEDVAALAGLRFVITSGLPEEALLQLVRVYSDALRRVAEAETRLFHIYVHERLRMEGLSGAELDDTVEATSSRVEGLAEPTILYFHRRAWARAFREDLVLHVAEEVGLRDDIAVLGEMTAGVAFVDLSSFTPLTEAMGDVKAADVIDRFSELVRQCVRDGAGRVVKQIGDGFMLLFQDASSAVSTALAIRDRVAEEAQFPAVRAGIHWGPMLYREGDYVGAVVNTASRLSTRARRHQVLVTSAVRREAAGLDAVEFVPLGPEKLKGVADQVELFEARREAEGSDQKVVDPVCGMELRPHEASARLEFRGVDQLFCSSECLRRFVAEPEKYRVSSGS